MNDISCSNCWIALDCFPSYFGNVLFLLHPFLSTPQHFGILIHASNIDLPSLRLLMATQSIIHYCFLPKTPLSISRINGEHVKKTFASERRHRYTVIFLETPTIRRPKTDPSLISGGVLLMFSFVLLFSLKSQYVQRKTTTTPASGAWGFSSD